MAEIRIAQWPEPVPAKRGSILDAALKAGVPFPHACRAGECGQCKCRLTHGMVEHDPYAPEALPEGERGQGMILACRARPQGDVAVAWLADAAPANPLRVAAGTVTFLEAATHDILKVRVSLDGEPLIFLPGQFARLTFPGQPSRAYSIASLPGAEELEFHIRRVPAGRVSGFVAESLRAGDRVQVEGPCGEAHLRADGQPTTVLVAGGSGLAPVLSILRSLLAKGVPGPVHLYHGVRDKRDLYEREWLTALADAGKIAYTPVLSQPAAPTTLATGFVHQAVGRDHTSLAAAEIYVCGPPPMVEAVQKLARDRGAAGDQVHADAFHAAPPERAGMVERFLGMFRRRA